MIKENKKPVELYVKLPIGVEINLKGSSPWQLVAIMVILLLVVTGIGWILVTNEPVDAKTLLIGIFIGAGLVSIIQTHTQSQTDTHIRKIKEDARSDIRESWKLYTDAKSDGENKYKIIDDDMSF